MMMFAAHFHAQLPRTTGCRRGVHMGASGMMWLLKKLHRAAVAGLIDPTFGRTPRMRARRAPNRLARSSQGV